MADPPSDAGAVQITDACALPAVASRLVGAPGTVKGVAVSTVEAEPVPAALLARTATE